MFSYEIHIKSKLIINLIIVLKNYERKKNNFEKF